MSNQCEHGQLVRTCLLCEMRGENLALRAQLEKALDAGVGYSQQTVDAIAGERDKLRAENVALKDALIYWLPEDCPLAYQDDPVSRAHRKEWVKTAKLIDDDGDQAFKARGEALMGHAGHARIHHQINWNNAAPLILSGHHKKAEQ